ncbi:MAG: Gfo/Idh/MocA family oxidoreductase [Pirellula sp.]|nr:Gfo/Idh/MocA family oxidoreductase [Pirellula sp.]MCY2977889.1 Gfo/Idh/MocA family oxidoreductase [Planctomycetota bacterium]
MKQISRRHFVKTTAVLGVAATTRHAAAYSLANDDVRLGFVGCGGRAGEHLQVFEKMNGVKIAGLCDPDQGKVAAAKERFSPDAKTWTDLRSMIDDKNIDAVVIASCNHWHCLAAIWAMQAGKDVYVEKPLSHSQWEGKQTVAAARKYNRVCQVGTQQRSDPMQAEIKKFLHEEKGIGKILSARVNRYGVRDSIGLRTSPLNIDPKIDYNLWLGPAQQKPIYREKLHYDWHWDWNTGSGEMGNWGVHVLDDLRNNVFLDQVSLPHRILGGGGRVVWKDAGETPNVHFVYFDTGSIPVVIGLTNLPASPTDNKSPKCPGPGSGYVAYCEGGRFEGQRGSGTAFDLDGKVIKKFKGNSGGRLHQENFVQAVRKRDPSMLNTDVEVGHHSTGWCNLANVAFRTGTKYSQEKAESIKSKEWTELLGEMKQLMTAHGLTMESASMLLGPMLTIDPKTELFTGEHAEQANPFLKRQYRAPFVVPESV